MPDDAAAKSMQALRESLSAPMQAAHRKQLSMNQLRDSMDPEFAMGKEEQEASKAAQIAAPGYAQKRLEKAAEVPMVQGILGQMARVISPAVNVAGGVVHGGLHFAGVEGAGEKAKERFSAAGRNIKNLGHGMFAPLPFIEAPVDEPGDLRFFGDFLRDDIELPTLGSINTPMFGEVTGRGVAGFAMDVFFDPLRVTRFGALTKPGVLAKKAGTLAKLGLVEGAGGVPKVVGPMAAQAAKGQRAMMTFMGKTVIKGEPVIRAVENALQKAGSSGLGKLFSVSRGRQDILKNLMRAQRAGLEVEAGAESTAATFMAKLLREAEASNITLDEAMAKTLLTTRGHPGKAVRAANREAMVSMEKIETEILRKRGYLQSLDDAATSGRQVDQTLANKLRHQVDELDKKFNAELEAAADLPSPDQLPKEAAARTKARQYVDSYMRNGYSARESVRAARAVMVHGADPAFAPIAAGFIEQMRKLGVTEIDAGGVLKTMLDPGKYYMLQYLTPDARAALSRKGLTETFRNKVAWSAKHASLKRRNQMFAGSPIPEINDYVRTHFPEFARQGIKFFEDNPAVLARVRATRTARVATASEFWKEIGRDYGRPGTQAIQQAGWVQIGRLLEESALKPARGLREAGDIWVPQEIAKAAKQVSTLLASPDAPGRFLGAWDGFNRAWKTGVTIPFPEFAVRNTITDVFSNYIGDVNPLAYGDAARLWKAWMGKSAASFSMGGMNGDEILRIAHASNALVTWQKAELGAAKAAAPKSGLRRLASLAGKPVTVPAKAYLKGAFAVNEHAQHIVRLAHILDKLKKGFDIDDAIMSMKAHLFDYTQLTKFEKGVLRRIVPFYSWLRFNQPFMLKTLVQKPGKIAMAGHIQRLLQGSASEEGWNPVDSALAPSYVSRRIFGLQPDPEDKNTIVARSGVGFGFEDLAIWDRPLPEFLASLNPLIKAMLQEGTKMDLWRQQPRDRAEVAPSIFRYLGHVPGGQELLDIIDFKPVKDQRTKEVLYYRANPRILNILLNTPASRAATTMSRFDLQRDGQPDPTTKSVLGWRVTKIDRRLVQARAMAAHLEEELAKEVGPGNVGISRRYYPRRGLIDTPKEYQELRRMTQKLSRLKEYSRKLGRQMQPEGKALRGAGQR